MKDMKLVIAIIAIVCLSVVAASIVFGIKTFSGVVTQHPYEKGLAWDHDIKIRRELGWKASLDDQKFLTGKNRLTIIMTDKEGRPLNGAVVDITRSRPNTTAYDKKSVFKDRGDGVYLGSIAFPVYGYWDLDVAVSKDGKSVLLKRRIFAEKGGS